VKDRILQSLTILMLICFLAPSFVYGTPLSSYTNDINTDFTLTDFNGQTHSLHDYKGKVVLINFWASWCPPCIYEMPELQKLKKHFSNRPFEVLTINVGEKKYRVRKFSKIISLDLPVLLDTQRKIFQQWNIQTLPSSFLVDKNGQIRYAVQGNPGWDNKDNLSIIEKLIP